MPSAFNSGDVLLADLAFPNQAGLKRRPVMGVRDDVLVVPITSQMACTEFDISLTEWRTAGLRLASIVRVEKFSTIAKSLVIRRLGRLSAADESAVRNALRGLCTAISKESES